MSEILDLIYDAIGQDPYLRAKLDSMIQELGPKIAIAVLAVQGLRCGGRRANPFDAIMEQIMNSIVANMQVPNITPTVANQGGKAEVIVVEPKVNQNDENSSTDQQGS